MLPRTCCCRVFGKLQTIFSRIYLKNSSGIRQAQFDGTTFAENMLQLKSRLVIITVFSFLLILGGAVYLPGVSGPFLFDDYGNIITNAYLQIHSLDAES